MSNRAPWKDPSVCFQGCDAGSPKVRKRPVKGVSAHRAINSEARGGGSILFRGETGDSGRCERLEATTNSPGGWGSAHAARRKNTKGEPPSRSPALGLAFRDREIESLQPIRIGDHVNLGDSAVRDPEGEHTGKPAARCH